MGYIFTECIANTNEGIVEKTRKFQVTYQNSKRDDWNNKEHIPFG
jgi:hypothetical protein